MILRRNNPRRRPGMTTVEMALVVGVALLLLFGILEYGRFVFFLHVAQNAAREGARFAVVRTGNVVTSADVNTIKGNMSDTASYIPGTAKWASGSTIRGVVNAKMTGQQNMLVNSSYNVDAYQANTATGLPINGTVANSNWSDASFGGAICVTVTGTYRFYAASLLHISNSDLPITVREYMSSEAN